MLQRNDTGSVLVAFDLDGKAQDIGPTEEFDSDLPVPGCTRVTPPAAPKTPAKTAESGKEPPA